MESEEVGEFEPRDTERAFTYRQPRFVADFPVLVTRDGGVGPVHLHGQCLDYSEAGMAVVLTRELLIGDVVRLRFKPPAADEPMELKARVLYRRQSQHGFYFIEVEQWQGELLSSGPRTPEPPTLRPLHSRPRP